MMDVTGCCVLLGKSVWFFSSNWGSNQGCSLSLCAIPVIVFPQNGTVHTLCHTKKHYNPVVLVADRQDPHSRDVEMLQHGVYHWLCLLTHNSLLAAVRSFFKTREIVLYEEAAVCVRSHGCFFTKIEFRSIFCKAWMNAVTAGKADFGASGSWPLNMV
jgi:hypothetical protein